MVGQVENAGMTHLLVDGRRSAVAVVSAEHREDMGCVRWNFVMSHNIIFWEKKKRSDIMLRIYTSSIRAKYMNYIKNSLYNKGIINWGKTWLTQVGSPNNLLHAKSPDQYHPLAVINFKYGPQRNGSCMAHASKARTFHKRSKAPKEATTLGGIL